jgi:hypothetical protein
MRAPVPRAVLAGALVALWTAGAGGAEPRLRTEPRVLEQPAQVTNVLDAFGEAGGIDLHVSLGYQHSWKGATLLRESTGDDAPSGGYTAANLGVGRYNEITSRLNVRTAVGLYRDVQLVLRLPIVLANSREIAGIGGSALVQDVVLAGLPGERLFTLPFKAPTRSGVEYLAVGFDVGVLNQYREPSDPTISLGIEGRFSVSEPMHACGPGVVRCAYPADIDRDGTSGGSVVDLGSGRSESLEGEGFSGGRKPGVSRGTTGLELHGSASRRYRFFEPYVALSALLELDNPGSDFAETVGPDVSPQLPVRGSFSAGVEVMPLELVDRFQRFSIDVRFTGSHVSRGLDYSELFDPLGSSPAPSLRQPNYARYHANPDPDSADEIPSVADPESEHVFTTGISEVEAHSSYRFQVNLRWQAGPYVSFAAGGAFMLTQAHLITQQQPCRGEIAPLAQAGPCIQGEPGAWQAQGTPDPSFRPTIDSPGRRFKVDDANTFDTWVNATVMF